MVAHHFVVQGHVAGRSCAGHCGIRLEPSCTRGDIIDQTLVHGSWSPINKNNECITRAQRSKFFGTLIRTLELGVDLGVHKLARIKFCEMILLISS